MEGPAPEVNTTASALAELAFHRHEGVAHGQTQVCQQGLAVSLNCRILAHTGGTDTGSQAQLHTVHGVAGAQTGVGRGDGLHHLHRHRAARSLAGAAARHRGQDVCGQRPHSCCCGTRQVQALNHGAISAIRRGLAGLEFAVEPLLLLPALTLSTIIQDLLLVNEHQAAGWQPRNEGDLHHRDVPDQCAGLVGLQLAKALSHLPCEVVHVQGSSCPVLLRRYAVTVQERRYFLLIFHCVPRVTAATGLRCRSLSLHASHLGSPGWGKQAHASAIAPPRPRLRARIQARRA
mmetsp:Transcript_123459/g.343933  ORF Transcript_123459/g.343933 Transcript_123459/m.343933 type:complete len:290 (+) Transcript_123459:2009-2878(+)